ncbi:DUF2254 domain-containing protein [Corynebacterium halotolerans]|uniref:DUF2254 domain-containing protein n=1 Tax=Corynebacterium halotolerans TaxID=225326 RepID=UPI003CF02CFA
MARGNGISWKLRLAALRYRFKESLFFYPSLIMLVGIVLALVTPAIDNALGYGSPVPFTVAMSSNAATWLLATVAGAMITTVGVVFSLTVVSLQLASGQFSPRVMRSFIRDRLSQRVIGFLLATFFYCVLVLPRISGEPTDPAPQISLMVAIVLTLVTVIGIILHLDHLAHGLQVGNVARSIEVEGEAVATAHDSTPPGLQHADAKEFHDAPDEAVVISSPFNGWVSQIDLGQLFKAAPAGTVVRMETRVGAYIHSGEPLITAWPPLPERNRKGLAEAIEISDARAMLQDVDFAIRQLVDIGLRALSPAINDPTTAVEVILRLGSLLRTVLAAPLAPPALKDGTGRVLVQPWNLSHEEYISHAFDQLRQKCLDQTEVTGTLLRVLRMLMDHVQDEDREHLVGPLQRQVRLLLESLREQPGLHPEDVERLYALVSEDTDPADHSR